VTKESPLLSFPTVAVLPVGFALSAPFVLNNSLLALRTFNPSSTPALVASAVAHLTFLLAIKLRSMSAKTPGTPCPPAPLAPIPSALLIPLLVLPDAVSTVESLPLLSAIKLLKTPAAPVMNLFPSALKADNPNSTEQHVVSTADFPLLPQINVLMRLASALLNLFALALPTLLLSADLERSLSVFKIVAALPVSALNVFVLPPMSFLVVATLLLVLLAKSLNPLKTIPDAVCHVSFLALFVPLPVLTINTA
jgi:hypothetical protein